MSIPPRFDDLPRFVDRNVASFFVERRLLRYYLTEHGHFSSTSG